MQHTIWRIELLGWLRAERDGVEVTRFATHHTAALLARLALWPRRAHGREELAELLWPDVPSDASRARLRQALTSLRHQLEPPGTAPGSVLIADRTHIRINPSAISTDVADFDAAVRTRDTRRAREVYTAELLPGFYEEWILDERDRLEALFDQIDDFPDTDSGRDPFSPSAPASAAAATPPVIGATDPMPAVVVRLPLQFTRFFGRTQELTQVGDLLAEHRLVTLTGPGGAGKTRLSIEAARNYGAAMEIVFVGLADIAPGDRLALLIEAVIEALRLTRDAGRPTFDLLVEALSTRSTLLVLDNAEHVAVAAAQLALVLLSRVPSLRLLVTSRRRLHIAGEREFPVPALAMPAADDSDWTPEALAAMAAVQLFVDRAQAVRPDFQITLRNAPDVGALCRSLEGAPLAIELAAARAATLTPAQMVTRLSQRFEFLATRRTDKDARHRSLWAAISWSVALLPLTLAVLWKRLSVFRGGFCAESVSEVTGDTAAEEALTQLRERSLIVLVPSDTEMRFRLLESMREFAEAEWDPDDRDTIEKRHAHYFLALAQEGDAALRGPEQTLWLPRLDYEQDNLRAALAYGLAHEDTEYTQWLAGSLWGYWQRRGQLAEARMWLESALALPGETDTAARVLALDRLGGTLNYCGSLDEAETIHQETLDACIRLNDERGIALAWNRLGYVAAKRGDDAAARVAFTEALARERALGNLFNIAAAVVNLGIIAQNQKDLEQARLRYAEALTLFESLGNPSGVADAYLNLGAISMAEERWEEALTILERAAEGFESVGDRWSGAYAMHNLSIVARNQNRLEDAEDLANRTLRICTEVGDRSKTGDAHFQLGLITRARGNHAESLQNLQQALQIYREIGQAASEARCLQELETAVRQAPDA